MPAQLFLPAGGRFSDAVLLPHVCIQKVMEKGKQCEGISITFIPVGSQNYQLKGTEKHESFNTYRLHLKAVLFVLYSKPAVVDIYNWYKYTLTHACVHEEVPEIPIYFPKAGPLQPEKSHVIHPGHCVLHSSARG